MCKAFIVDDEKDEAKRIGEYIHEKLKEIHCDTHILRKGSGTDVRLYTKEEQTEKLETLLKDNWGKYDFFIIDMALLGMPLTSPLVSQSAIKQLLTNNKDCFRDVNESKKFIIIITGMGVQDSPLDLTEPLLEKIVHIYKPDKFNEPQITQKSLCGAKKYCEKYEDNDEKCDQNECLVKILNTLNKRRSI